MSAATLIPVAPDSVEKKDAVSQYEVEAASLEEARQQMQSQMPAGHSLLSEKIVSDGKAKTAGAIAETIEKAFTEAHAVIPGDAVVAEEKVITNPEERLVKVEGFEEDAARQQIERGLDSSATVKSFKLLFPGRNGFLGIGRKPNQYEAKVFQPAIVEVRYQQKARISVKTGFKNRGDRHEDLSQAVAYWMTRMRSPKKDPFVMYYFESEKDARAALLELPCIHVGEDGKLICTEYLIFGYYRQADGNYEALICGDELTHDLWEQAKASFEKHGGKRKNDLEPENRPTPARPMQAARPEAVVFVREDRKPSKLQGAVSVYRIHKGPDAASAREFLESHPVTQQFYYLIVETPEGNFGRDIQGMYKE